MNKLITKRNEVMTIQEAILDLFIACGAQEMPEILQECRRQYDEKTTVQQVSVALSRLLNVRKIASPDGIAWGLPSDF